MAGDGKEKQEIPVINLFPKEYKTYKKRDYGLIFAIFLFIIVILLFGMAYYLLSGTNAELKNKTGGILIVIATVILIGLILWSVRKRIMIFILSFTLLITTYLVEGMVVSYLGLIPSGFSWGLVTLIIISAFAYWFGTDIDWGDFFKVVLFLIVMYMLNSAGWMASANAMAHNLVSLQTLLKSFHSGGGLNGFRIF